MIVQSFGYIAAGVVAFLYVVVPALALIGGKKPCE